MLDKNKINLVIFISLLAAFLLAAMPLPDWANPWRPMWVIMVFIYWCIVLPDKVGIGIGWLIGLLIDVQQGLLLGQSALGLALLAYVIIKIYKRLRVFPLIQQSCLLGLMLIFYLLVVIWIRGILGEAYYIWNYWMSVISSALLWPWLFSLLGGVRRRYNIG